jgi:hypothetical protein
MNQHNIYYEAPMPVNPEATMLGPDLHEWHKRMDALMTQGARIITFRGAGTVNGIEPRAADVAITILHKYVTGIAADGTPVVLMHDGDRDNRQRPDIGSVFGGLFDSLDGDPRVTVIAAQTEGRYSPKIPNSPIESATGKLFETFIFPDDTPGGHASLTQSEALVNYSGYEQVFVGPAGPIAFNQLGDLSQKSAHRPVEKSKVRVTVIATPNNSVIDEDLNSQLSTTTDEQTRAKVKAKVTQRAQQPYGALFTPNGEFSVDANQYPGINFNVIYIHDDIPH